MALPALPAIAGIKAGLAAVSPRTWKIIGAVVGVLLLCWFVWHKIDAFGDRRYEAGIKAEREAWQEADRKLQEKAAKARTEADRSAAIREARHAEAVEEERKKIDEAVAQGTSPLDVLFGG